MKEKVQNKINRVRELAKGSVKATTEQGRRTSRPNDSLSKAIRNAKEANIFLAELDAAIAISQKG
jgi:hypothetical protein